MQIDFFPAGKSALLILTGRGGDPKGYRNKYVKIAENVNRKFDFSVFVAGVPENCWDDPKQIFCEAIDRVFLKMTPERFYVAGNSAGANLVIWYSHLFPTVDRVLAINPVLNLNMHDTDNGIARFNGEILYILSGEQDPAAMWQEVLPQKENVSVRLLKGVDHVFTGKLNEFVALSDLLFDESIGKKDEPITLSHETLAFLKGVVFPHMGITSVTSGNISAVCEYFVQKCFMPVLAKEDRGEMESAEDRKIVKLVCRVLSELKNNRG